ncbi:MAG TPA: polysaccharide deacetylase family protein, partial [Armatimonadota bacterium]|nr:polysaccharide deacetylase family protein [Armatimonadota bacterium]
MYHEVQDPARPNPSAPPSWTVDIDSFRQQMERLRSAGYTGMSVSRWLAERPIQRCRPVVLTFDDGLRGNIDHALPVLLEMGWTATFFITTAM